jgi:hypothetical protein
MRRFIRRVSDFRTGCTTLFYKDDDFKYKLTIHPDDDLITLRRRTRDERKHTEYYVVEYINLYRAFGDYVADGTFSASPGTEFVMAMLGPCVNALESDSGSKKITAVVETSCLEVIVESWSKNGLVAPVQFAKYHMKFRLDRCDDDASEDEEPLPPPPVQKESRKKSDDGQRRRSS